MKINVNLNFSVLIGDRNDVGYLVMVLFFPDETRVYELFNF